MSTFKHIKLWFSDRIYRLFIFCVSVAIVMFSVGTILCVADHYLHFSCQRELTDRIYDWLWHAKAVILVLVVLFILWLKGKL